MRLFQTRSVLLAELNRIYAKVLLSVGCMFAGTSLAEVNYFDGSANNRLKNGNNWSLGRYANWDDAVFIQDGATWRNELVTTSTEGTVAFNSVVFNGKITAKVRMYSNYVGAPIYVRTRTTVGSDVAGIVQVDGHWRADDNDLNVYPNGTSPLWVSWRMSERSGNHAQIAFIGNNRNPVVFTNSAVPGVSGSSSYTGKTILRNVDAMVYSANSATNRGTFGNGGNLVLGDAASLALVGDGSFNNGEVTLGAGCVLDVSGRTSGGFSYDGVLRGGGNVVGDMALSGELRSGGGTGGTARLVFEDTLSMEAGSTVFFELNGDANGEFDSVASDGGGDLAVDAASAWIFDFSGWSTGVPTHGSSFSVLDGWSGISGSSSRMAVTGLPSGMSLDTSALFTYGIVTVVRDGESTPVEFSVDNDHAVMCWDGLANASYAVQYNTDLVHGTWSNVADTIFGGKTICVTNEASDPQGFYKILIDGSVADAFYLGTFDGFYRNRRAMDVTLNNASYKIIVPDWLCDPALDFPYERKDNPLVAADGKEVFLGDNLVLVRVLGGWVTNSASPTIEDVKQNDLFYLDENDQAAYRWNLLDHRIDPLMDRGYGCSNITLVLDNIPYDMVAPAEIKIETYGQVGIPQDFPQWGEFIRQLCLHLKSRYGETASNGFRFRLGTESQSAKRFDGTEQEYFKYYDYAENAIKGVLPDAQVGPFNRAQVGDPVDDTISLRRLAEHCAFGTNYASGAVGGEAFDWVAHSFYYLRSILHPDDFVPTLKEIYQDVQVVDGRYFGIPLELPEFGPLVTEGGMLSGDKGAWGAAKIFETLVDLKKIGMTRTYLWVQEETLGQLDGRILFSGIEWLYCIFDHLRGGAGWSLPFEIVGGSTANSIETLASVKDDATYILVSCWNVDRKATAGSTVEVTLPAGVNPFPGSVDIQQIVFDEATSVYDVIWNDFYTNNMLSSANLNHFINYGKAVTWATTGNGMAGDDPATAKAYVINNWPKYQSLMSDALALKPFVGTVQDLPDGGKTLTVTMPVPSVYVIEIRGN